MTPEAKRRSDRLSQQKHRGSRRSYVTEIENLQVLLAWEFGELSEGQAARATKMDRVSLRQLRLKNIQAGIDLMQKQSNPQEGE